MPTFERTIIGARTEIGARVSMFARKVMSRAYTLINLLRALSGRTTKKTALCYASDALYTDDPVLTELTVGEVAITGGRRATTVADGAVAANISINGEFTTDLSGHIATNSTNTRVDSLVDPGVDSGGVDSFCIKEVAITNFPVTKYTLTTKPGHKYIVTGRAYAPSTNAKIKAARLSWDATLGTVVSSGAPTTEDEWQDVEAVFIASGTTGKVITQARDITGDGSGNDVAYFDKLVVTEIAPTWYATDINGVAFPTTPTLSNWDVAENVCTDSRTFDGVGWGGLGTPIIAKNAVGIDGIANSATTITDDSASYESVSFNVPIVAGQPTAARVYIKKTVGAVTFPGVVVQEIGGTAIQFAWAINTDTGVATGEASNPVSGGSISVKSFNSIFWAVTVTQTGITATTSRFNIYPAANADAGAIWSAATQGSVVADQVDIRTNQSYVGPDIITSGTTGTTDADKNSFILPSGVKGNDETLNVGIIPQVLTKEQWLLSNGTAGLYINAANKVVFTVGVKSVVSTSSIVADTAMDIKVVQSSTAGTSLLIDDVEEDSDATMIDSIVWGATPTLGNKLDTDQFDGDISLVGWS